MDLIKIIGELSREKEKLDRAIAALENVQSSATGAAPQKKRRGRKSMSPEERREVAERMKKYWAGRRTNH